MSRMDWEKARRRDSVRQGARAERNAADWRWISIRLPGVCIFCRRRLRPGGKQVAWNRLTRKLACGRCVARRKMQVGGAR